VSGKSVLFRVRLVANEEMKQLVPTAPRGLFEIDLAQGQAVGHPNSRERQSSWQLSVLIANTAAD
jgi:hypothetical protein